MAREAAELRQLIASWDRIEKRARDLIELDQLADGDPDLEKQLGDEQVLAVRIGKADIRVAGVDMHPGSQRTELSPFAARVSAGRSHRRMAQ